MKISRINENEFEITLEPLIEKGNIKDLEKEISRLETEKLDFEEKNIAVFSRIKELSLKIEDLKTKIEDIKKVKIK